MFGSRYNATQKRLPLQVLPAYVETLLAVGGARECQSNLPPLSRVGSGCVNIGRIGAFLSKTGPANSKPEYRLCFFQEYPGDIENLFAQGLGAREIAKRLGVGRASVYRVRAASMSNRPSESRLVELPSA